jgi:5-methylcytosine-specific restriction endonuclease McrA
MKRPCIDCGRLISVGSRCRQCKRALERRRERATTTERGYGADWQKRSHEVIEAQPWCTCCGTEGDPSNPLTADHFVPKALRGTDDRENLVATCRRCNNAKRDRLREFLDGR